MSAHFLSYWTQRTAEEALRGDDHLLGHSASEQYGRVSKGDVVWIVTTLPGGYVILLGRILVAVRTDQVTAARLLGVKPKGMWEATYHILAVKGTERPLRAVDIGDLAESLRFASDKDRLTVSEGRVKKRQQLRSMRKLTADSAALLEERWSDEYRVVKPAEAARAASARGAGFGSAEVNRKVERKAIKIVRQHYRDARWRVRSVETKRIGYDLLCKRGTDVRHIEVKGVAGRLLTFIITTGELTQSKADPAFVLCVVTDALSSEAEIHEVTGVDMPSQFDFVPLAYRATPVM